MADYIIYKSGSNTVARNTATGSDQFTNASAASVFNSVLSTLNTAGSGGTVYVKRGTYDIGPGTITAYDNITIVGEDRDRTIIRSQDAANNVISKTGVILTAFKLRNISIESPGLGAPVYFAGATRCILQNCRFAFTSQPTAATIMVWFDSVNGTRQNYYNKITNNLFEGSTNGQDMLGGGCMNFSVISHNTFIGATGVGQAIGQSGCKFVTYSNNTFQNCGNFIGLEDAAAGAITSSNNVIIGNTAYNCGKLKLSLENADNTSEFNVCVGNTMIYGNSGIEDGKGYGDLIANNVIIRTTIAGIRGCFNRCVIQDNVIIETNHTSASSTLSGGVSRRQGGIMLQDNTAQIANPRGTVVQGNKIFRSGTSYTYEPDGTTKTGAGGGIQIGSSYTNVIIADNALDNITADALADSGTTTVNRTNDSLS